MTNFPKKYPHGLQTLHTLGEWVGLSVSEMYLIRQALGPRYCMVIPQYHGQMIFMPVRWIHTITNVQVSGVVLTSISITSIN